VSLSSISSDATTPTIAKQVMVSDRDRHVIVFGCDGETSIGTQDPLLIRFSSQESLTTWKSEVTNTAGELRLGSGSEIVTAVETRQQILVFTDVSLHAMQFIGPPLTFALNLINEGAGLIGPKAVVNAPNGVFFMSKNAFYFYNGSIKKLNCSVQDFVFSDLDVDQSFKCFAGLNEEFSEIWFFYPSKTDDTNEISRYVIYNYEENSWSIGSLKRYSWLNPGINEKPLVAGETSSSKVIYQHETGSNDDLSSMDNVFIESADIDITDGDNFVFLKKVIPDILFQNDLGSDPDAAINIVVKRRDFTNQTLTTDSTTQIKNSSTFSSLRTRTRQFVLRFESDDDNTEADRKDFKWRLGNTRIDIQQSGRR
jgi:hypothetical protein